MKKALLIAFTGVYLAVSLGISLNFHYCGGRLANVGIALPAAKCCCDAADNSNCCSDESISLQMDLDQQITYPPSWELNFPQITTPDYLFFGKSISLIPEKITPHYPNPPPLRSQDARIEMGSLTYYG